MAANCFSENAYKILVTKP